MRKVKKKNVLNKIDDAINDKIEEIKENKKNKKSKTKGIKIYDYERESSNEEKDSIISFDEEMDDTKENSFSFDELDKNSNDKKETKEKAHDEDFFDEVAKEKEKHDDDFVEEVAKEKEKQDDDFFDNELDKEDTESKKSKKEKKKFFNFAKKKTSQPIDEDDKTNELDIDSEDNVKQPKSEKDKKKLFAFKKKNIPVVINDDESNEEDVQIKTEKKKKENKKKIFTFKKKNKPVIINDTNNNDDEIEDEDVVMKKGKKKKNNTKKHAKNNKKNYKEPKKKRSFWKKLVTFILILGIIGVLSVAAFLGYIVATAPEFSDSALIIKDQTVIYDVNGAVIAKLGSEKRESVAYDALPQVLIDAIIATEDSRFFQHNGVDLFRFIKATLQQLMGQDDAGGASTLTMQTVKNNITKKDSTENDSDLKGKIKKVIRKFQDVYLAVFKVEKEYSKEEILEMYVNDNFLGGSYYGVEEASKYYYGKSVSDLTLPEAALIAGLFQAPGRHNPYIDIDKATARRSMVLKLMQRHGYITEEERKMADSVPIKDLLVGRRNEETKYQGYIDAVVAEVEKITDHGDGTGGDNPYTVPMKIYTTMDPSIQDGINSVFASNDRSIWKDDKVQGGVAVVKVETGEIAALGAGRNKTGERQFNYATQAYRQPGSTAKPLFDYGPAIEYLNYSSYTLVMDEPWSYTNGPQVNNWDYSFAGLKTIRYHLQFSRNIPALKTFQAVGPANSQKFVASLGLDVSLNTNSDNYHVFENGLDNTINQAYSIGGAAKGFTPLNMAAAYAGFANGGYYIEPHTITKIIYRETGEEKEFKYTKERVMKDSTAYIMNNILESAVTGGFNGGANVAGSHVAAKTGTSNYDENTMKKYHLPGGAVNDLWTVAYTSKYSIAVWYGYDEVNSEYYNREGGYKEALTRSVMRYIPKDTVGWTRPSSVVPVTVERNTAPAALPSQFTPSDMMLTEYFVRGTQPTEVSLRYQKFSPISASSIKTTKKTNNTVTISWDYKTPTVLTDDYLQKYFSNSAFGNSKANEIALRKKYNQETLGGFGYGIYTKNADGSLTRIDWVTTNQYDYTGYGTVNLVIKAEYGKWKNNASDGANVTVALEELNVNNLHINIKGLSPSLATAGNYTEQGIESVTYNGNDITNDKNVVIRYQITTGGNVNDFNSATELETFINTLEAGTYSITYNVKYLSAEKATKRTIILK